MSKLTTQDAARDFFRKYMEGMNLAVEDVIAARFKKAKECSEDQMMSWIQSSIAEHYCNMRWKGK